MGAPGVGKGTQAEWMAKEYGLKHISTGNLLRSAVRGKTPLGLQAQDYMNKGQLVPDSVMNALVEEVLDSSGFILDGFPRTVAQAQALDSLAQKRNLKIHKVFLLVLEEEELIQRVSGRRVALQSGRVYHTVFSPPQKKGFCDETGEPLIQREDDKPEVVRARLRNYFSQQEPLTEYYKEQGLVQEVSAQGSPQEVRSRIEEILKKN